jgi:hypothetical protein
MDDPPQATSFQAPAARPAAPEPQPSTAQVLEQLRNDRIWLLRQLDSGRWPEWRLDLAALERELGHLLEQAGEQAQNS